MTLVRNAVRCHRCGTVAESTHVHLTVHDDDAHVEAWEVEQWRRGVADAEAQVEALRAKVLDWWRRYGR